MTRCFPVNGGIIFVLLIFVATLTFAESPRVRFDVENVVECRDVTPPEFAATHVTERLVEVPLRISSLIYEGRENELVEYLYRINSPAESVRIVDYFPKTSLTTNIDGTILVERKEEKVRSLGLTLSGQFNQLAKAGATGEVGAKKTDTLKYQKLPAMNLLSSAGTIDGGFGVYFKLKPSPQTSLEGEKLILLTLRVPVEWRGDYLHIECDALGKQQNFVGQDDEIHSGNGKFVVTLYLEGDEYARQAAKETARTERELRSLNRKLRGEIARKSYPTLFHQFGAALDLVGPKISPTWLTNLVFTSPFESRNRLPNHLPVDVRVKALDYIEAKEQLAALSSVMPTVAEKNKPKTSRKK